jgi:hypothetical protein
MQPQISHGKQRLTYFQVVVDGDIKKLIAESNDADSGGGARDLRMPRTFWDALLPFFPIKNSKGQEAIVYSAPGGRLSSTSVSLNKPTTSRPNEIRIGKIHEIEGWQIPASEYEQAKKKGDDMYFLLTLDANGKTWARITKHSALSHPKAEPSFLEFVRTVKAACHERKKVARGIFDFTSNNHFYDE